MIDELTRRFQERFARVSRGGRAAAALGLVAVLAVLPFGLSSFWKAVLIDVLLFALLALGLNVVVGFAGLLDLGYVAFYAIGNYAFAIVTAGSFSKALFLHAGRNLPPLPAWQDWMWLLLPVGLVAAMVSGVVLGAPTLRLRGDYLAIVTLGFGEIVRIAARNFDTFTVGPRGITSIPHPQLNLGPVRYDFGLAPEGYYYLLLTLTILMVGVIVRLNNSKVGRAWAAIREDEVAAAAMGVPTVRMKLWAFAIGASTAGVAGVVQASRVPYVSPDSFVLLISFFILSMVVLGGMGSIVGSIVGAAVIVAIPPFLQNSFPKFQEYRYLLFGIVLVVMMIFRPQGLLPSRRRAIELRGEVRETSVYGVRAAQGQTGGSDGAS
ncbi:MAG: branched-chain amino acid ABC transporter permease [Actinomycetota bacterium]